MEDGLVAALEEVGGQQARDPRRDRPPEPPRPSLHPGDINFKKGSVLAV